VVALNNVTTRFPAGQVTALLGHNGAGKTTLVNCILGLKSFEGSITVNGLDVRDDSEKLRAEIGMGYVPQGDALKHTESTLVHVQRQAELLGIFAPEAVEAALKQVRVSVYASFVLEYMLCVKIHSNQSRFQVSR
jgi:ABC-type multidrug transport system ATPase subunit